MTVYRVLYMSNQYKVVGYLGIPRSLELVDEQSLLGAALSTREFNSGQPLISAVKVASSWTASTLPRDTEAGLKNGWSVTDPAVRYPGFIYCRGGIGRVGVVRLHWVEEFAAHGFVVFAPAYRGSEGGEGRDEFGGADCEDVHAGVRLLQGMPFVSPDNTVVMGFSRGSINAAATACEVRGIKGLILWGGVSDLSQTYAERMDLRRMLRRVVGGTPGRLPEAYEARSPLHRVSDIHCPTLLVHGTTDVQVDVSHATRMYGALKASGKAVDTHFYEGCGHHLPSPVHEAVVDRMMAWAKQVLQGR